MEVPSCGDAFSRCEPNRTATRTGFHSSFGFRHSFDIRHSCFVILLIPIHGLPEAPADQEAAKIREPDSLGRDRADLGVIEADKEKWKIADEDGAEAHDERGH